MFVGQVHFPTSPEEPNTQPFSVPIRTLLRGVLQRLREDGVEVELLDEGPAAPHPDLPIDILEMVFHRVFGDLEDLGDLLGGSPANGQVDHFLLAGA